MRILVVDDEENIREGCRRSLERIGHEVEVAAEAKEALAKLDGQGFDLALLDIRMPGLSGVELLEAVKARDAAVAVVMMTGYASIESAVECMKKGAEEYVAKPFKPDDIREVVERILAERTATPATEMLVEELSGTTTRRVIFGSSRAMRQVHRLIGKVATQSSNVLVTGESGTGKELVARLVHCGGPRAEKPFVVVNCAAIPDSLLESELFGHKKGAFTGADYDREGSFQAANTGTLFLDEIAEMAPAMQAKILRAIELGEIKRIGSDKPARVDVRIIAATNRDLNEHVEAGEFRRDLFYRLNVVNIDLPPLRKRKDDIAMLTQYFVETFARDMGRAALRVDAKALEALEAYSWPGNVRELENAVERAVMMADGSAIRVRDLPREVAGAAGSAAPTGESTGGANWDALASEGTMPTLDDVGLAYIREMVQRCKGNRTKAAKLLGITPVTIWRKLGGAKEDKA